MIKDLRSLKKSEFIQSLSEKLSEKKIEIENISTVSGSTTVRSRPMLRYIIVLSDSQEVDLLIDRKTGTIEYASIDDKTVQDFDDVNEEKMPKFLAEHIIKRSAVKVKQELFKNIDVEKFGNATENRDKKKIEDLKAEIEAKKTSIADLKSKLPTTIDDVDTDGIFSQSLKNDLKNIRMTSGDISKLTSDGDFEVEDIYSNKAKIKYKNKLVGYRNDNTEKVTVKAIKNNPLVVYLAANSFIRFSDRDDSYEYNKLNSKYNFDDVDTDGISFSNVRIKDYDIDRLSDDGFTVFDDRIEYKRKVVAKYNEKTEKISIVGEKTVKNPLVEWLLENSMLDSDTSEKLRK